MGMYETKARDYLKEKRIFSPEKNLCAVMRKSKFDSFPEEDRNDIKECSENDLLNLTTSMLTDPCNENAEIEVQIISVPKRDQLNL